MDREPITDANRGQAMTGGEITERNTRWSCTPSGP